MNLSSLPTAMNWKPSPGTAQGICGREDVESAGDSLALGGLEDPRQGSPRTPPSGHGSVGRAHRVGQVVGSDEDGVDARHGVDLVGHIDGSMCSVWMTTRISSLA